MNYYRNPTTGEVFAYDSKAEREEYGAPELVEMSDEEVAQHLTPVPQVPQEVSMRQARLALLDAGKLASVDAAIDALPEPHRTAARIEWEYSASVRRHQPFVLQLAPALGLDAAGLDTLFTQAAAL